MGSQRINSSSGDRTRRPSRLPWTLNWLVWPCPMMKVIRCTFWRWRCQWSSQTGASWRATTRRRRRMELEFWWTQAEAMRRFKLPMQARLARMSLLALESTTSAGRPTTVALSFARSTILTQMAPSQASWRLRWLRSRLRDSFILSTIFRLVQSPPMTDWLIA